MHENLEEKETPEHSREIQSTYIHITNTECSVQILDLKHQQQ